MCCLSAKNRTIEFSLLLDTCSLDFLFTPHKILYTTNFHIALELFNCIFIRDGIRSMLWGSEGFMS